MPEALVILAIVAGALAVAFLAAAIMAARRKRLFGTAAGVTLSLLLFALAALTATISVATQGYRALTREELAATVVVRPTGPTQFTALVIFPDGRDTMFVLRGEQVYVDAHILKWKPIANVLGLHTAYELDRIGGRYLELEDERDSTRTIFSLSAPKPVDMFTLRRRWAAFTPLLDAEYGSGTFVTAERRDSLEVLVSTSGLLIRRVSR
jgi:sugar/nucleoside kinase (ribokinase family)